MTHPHHEAQGFTILLRALRIFSYLLSIFAAAITCIIVFSLAVAGYFVWAGLLLVVALFAVSLVYAMTDAAA
jgi:hypothetical protein